DDRQRVAAEAKPHSGVARRTTVRVVVGVDGRVGAKRSRVDREAVPDRTGEAPLEGVEKGEMDDPPAAGTKDREVLPAAACTVDASADRDERVAVRLRRDLRSHLGDL